MTRADRIAAALERWRIETEPGADMPSMPSVKAAGEALAALLRKSQPEPAPVGGEDEALLEQADKDAAYLHARNWNDMGFTVQHLATRLRAALADVARLAEAETVLAAWHAVFGTTQLTHAKARLEKAESDVRWLTESRDAAEKMTHLYAEDRNEARAALATAEEAKAKAVAEEREACRMIAANYALNCVDSAGRFAANTIGERIRARAGRNDAG